jgi:hypothetical protein
MSLKRNEPGVELEVEESKSSILFELIESIRPNNNKLVSFFMKELEIEREKIMEQEKQLLFQMISIRDALNERIEQLSKEI